MKWVTLLRSVSRIVVPFGFTRIVDPFDGDFLEIPFAQAEPRGLAWIQFLVSLSAVVQHLQLAHSDVRSVARTRIANRSIKRSMHRVVNRGQSL